MAKSLLIACVLLGTFPALSVANNNLFLPGDAYFPTVLTKVDVDALHDTKSDLRTFRYSSLDGYEGAFCGYAGYQYATITSVDDAFVKNLERVYADIRLTEGRLLRERITAGKTELIETNGIRVLFYPAEFSFPEHVLGLRYNEGWVAEVLKFGHKRDAIRMCTLLADRDALELEWRDADVVPALKVSLPTVPLKPVPATTVPVVAEGQVKAIVIGSQSLADLFHSNTNDFQSTFVIYIVDSKGITTLVNKEGTWEPRTSD